jgi:hypothetical protein
LVVDLAKAAVGWWYRRRDHLAKAVMVVATKRSG